MLPLILQLVIVTYKSLHHQELLTEHLRAGLSSIQITPGVSRVAISQGTEAIPEISWVALGLGLRRNRHFRTLGSDRTLELLTNGLHLTLAGVTNLFIGDRIRAVLTEELTGVISKNIRISQDGLISLMLMSQFLKKADSFNQLLVGLDQIIFQLTRIIIQDSGSIRAKMINNF